MKIAPLLALAFLVACGSAHSAPAADATPLADVEKMATGGNREAMHALCYRYKYGVDAPDDLPAALRWCSVAAVLGVDSSQVLLAEIFHDGEAVPRDDARALQWYEAGAEQGHPHALLMLFYMYDEGIGAAPDHARALRYLEEAAASGYGKAIEELSRQQPAKPRAT